MQKYLSTCECTRPTKWWEVECRPLHRLSAELWEPRETFCGGEWVALLAKKIQPRVYEPLFSRHNERDEKKIETTFTSDVNTDGHPSDTGPNLDELGWGVCVIDTAEWSTWHDELKWHDDRNCTALLLWCCCCVILFRLFFCDWYTLHIVRWQT